MTTSPDSVGIPSPGVSMVSGDLEISSMGVPLGDPFGGDCIELIVTKKVNLAQLTDEIQRRTKTVPQLAMRQPNDQDPTAENPYVLWVHPGTLSVDICQSVLDKHVPIPPTYNNDGQTEDITTAPAAVTVTPQFNEGQQKLVEQLQQGKELTASESSDLLRAILGITS